MTWPLKASAHLAALGPVVHVAAGRTAPDLDVTGPVGAALWAVGRVPDEVVARLGPERLDALLSWGTDVEAEVTARAGAPREWLVVTTVGGELEVRGEPFTGAAVELWVSDGTGTERHPVTAAAAPALARPTDLANVLDAIGRSAADGGAPVVILSDT